MRKFILIVALCLSTSLVGSAENLDKLLFRAQRYLEARAAVNKLEMAKYVPLDKRGQFLERNPPPMSKAQLEGFEFTSDPKTVKVVYSATFTLQDVGPIPTKVAEAWIWDGKDWFLKLEELGSPFAITKNAPASPSPKPLPFELLTSKIDLGKHTQGEVIARTIDFKSDQDTFNTFRQNDLKGLLITGPTWTSKDTGQFGVVLDTTLLNANVNYAVELGVTGWQLQKLQAKFEVTAEIVPRLRFSQTPEIIDPAVGGSVEISIENLTDSSFTPVSLVLTNAAYKVLDYGPKLVAPGKTLKITVGYQPQTTVQTGAVLNVATSPAALTRPDFVLPLNIKLPVTQGVGYTREELDEMLKRAK